MSDETKTAEQVVAEATGGASESDDLIADIRAACLALEAVGVHSILFAAIGNDGQAFTNVHGDTELVFALLDRFMNEVQEMDQEVTS